MNPVLRDVGAADEDFLFRVFAASREAESSFLPEPQRLALLRMQFEAQWRNYAARYPHGRQCIVSVGDADVGRLWVGEDDTCIVILDIALLPEYRGRGIGSSLYARIIEQAREAGKMLRASVSTANPGSLRFHARMGFSTAGGDEMYLSLARHPEAGETAAFRTAPTQLHPRDLNRP